MQFIRKFINNFTSIIGWFCVNIYNFTTRNVKMVSLVSFPLPAKDFVFEGAFGFGQGLPLFCNSKGSAKAHQTEHSKGEEKSHSLIVYHENTECQSAFLCHYFSNRFWTGAEKG